jgi:hypothetical protein
MPRKSISQKISTNTIAQHMTVELEILNQSANHAKDMLMNKVNFFLALVTAIGGGLAYMFTLDKLPNCHNMHCYLHSHSYGNKYFAPEFGFKCVSDYFLSPCGSNSEMVR